MPLERRCRPAGYPVAEQQAGHVDSASRGDGIFVHQALHLFGRRLAGRLDLLSHFGQLFLVVLIRFLDTIAVGADLFLEVRNSGRRRDRSGDPLAAGLDLLESVTVLPDFFRSGKVFDLLLPFAAQALDAVFQVGDFVDRRQRLAVEYLLRRGQFEAADRESAFPGRFAAFLLLDGSRSLARRAEAQFLDRHLLDDEFALQQRPGSDVEGYAPGFDGVGHRLVRVCDLQAGQGQPQRGEGDIGLGQVDASADHLGAGGLDPFFDQTVDQKYPEDADQRDNGDKPEHSLPTDPACHLSPSSPIRCGISGRTCCS